MKQDKKQELRNSTVSQLKKRVQKITDELVKVSLDLKTGKLKNVKTMKHLKKEIAFINTIITEKETDKSVQNTKTADE